MKMKTAIGSLVGFFMVAAMIGAPVYAEAPTYNATGTWDIKFQRGLTDCYEGPVDDESYTANINQSGDTFTIEFGQSGLHVGKVKGNRYHFFMFSYGTEIVGTQSFVWDLDSSSVGTGYESAVIIDQALKSYRCGSAADFHLQKRGICKPTDTLMCLRNGQFSVSVAWEDEHGSTGVGHTIPSTDDSGMFWFFSPSNMELLIKVLDGCGFNDHYWVFFAATTDQKFTVTVTDLYNAEQVKYTNPMKHPADAVTDTSAFNTCPQ